MLKMQKWNIKRIEENKKDINIITNINNNIDKYLIINNI